MNRIRLRLCTGIAEAGNQGLKDATFIDLYESHFNVQHNALTAPPYSRLFVISFVE